MTDRRSADDLRAVADQAWPAIDSLIAAAEVPVHLLRADARRRDAALAALQVTTASFLGAVVAECGGLLIDHGWLRMLGAGAGGLPGVHEANTITGSAPARLVVAWDVLGGRFAVNGGGLDAEPGEVCYWAPDTLQWTGIGGGYSAFLAWSLSPGLNDFYSALRWPGWQTEVDRLPADQGLSSFPPPFTAQGRDLSMVSRRPVPLTELHAFYLDVAQQLEDMSDGTEFRMNVTEGS